MHLGFVQPGSFWVRGVSCIKRLFGGDPDIPARWRALKRLAIEGHDNDREQQFFAMEVRSARFSTDWPAHWRVWDREAMTGVFRFWTGLLYQIFSNFGRSLIRPLAFWVVVMTVAAAAFLGAHHESAGRSAPGWRDRIATVARRAWMADANWHATHPCVAGYWPAGAQPETQATATDAVGEAWHLAFRNAFIVLDGGGDAAFRSYACLYGVTDYPGQTIANVPSSVAWVSVVQKAFSGVFIFLFGLALRNMLKMK
ncbi:MAG: hypothetical protein R3D33_12330 [Hyphomicrobiaceae bacterium]